LVPTCFLYDFFLIYRFFTALIERKPLVLNAKDLGYFILFAIVCVLNDLCLFWGYRVVSPDGIAGVAFTHQLVSVFLLVLVPFVLGERIRRTEWLALPVAIFGTALLFVEQYTFASQDLLGIVLGTLSAVFYAWIIIGYRYLPTKGFTNAQINALRYALSIVLIAPFINVFGAKALTAVDFGALAAFGIYRSAFAHTVYAVQ
jgi:drug/metabolite transporter (DMT)-like permease